MSEPDQSISARLAAVRGRIEAACRVAGRDPASVQLVCVSKKQPAEAVAEAYAAGARDFGENYIQELEGKREALADQCPDARWHFVGRVQRNKAKQIATATLVHGAGKASHLDALAKAAEPGQPVRALLQVNVGAEVTKSGLGEDQLLEDDELWTQRPGVTVEGLMTIPVQGMARQGFERLAALRDKLERDRGLSLPHLSMGMTADFEEAILCGATIVRVGTAVFGPRPT